MLFVERKRPRNHRLPAVGIVAHTAIAADDQTVGGARHADIKQPPIFLFGKRLQPLFVRTGQRVRKRLARQPGRNIALRGFQEPEFRHMR
ncbi:hypothetical protein D3C86_2011010 [compost metagenome]